MTYNEVPNNNVPTDFPSLESSQEERVAHEALLDEVSEGNPLTPQRSWDKIVSDTNVHRLRPTRGQTSEAYPKPHASATEIAHRHAQLAQQAEQDKCNPEQFMQLVAFLETHIKTRAHDSIELDSQISHEAKQQYLNEVTQQGWSYYEATAVPGESTDTIYLHKPIAFEIQDWQVPFVEQLINAHPEATEMLQQLDDLGCSIADYQVTDPEAVEELVDFLRAPYAHEALQQAATITSWDHVWFSQKLPDQQVAPGNLRLLTLWANENPSLTAAETSHRRNALSQHLAQPMGVELEQEYQRLEQDPRRLAILANHVLPNLTKSHYYLPIMARLDALEQEGLLEPLYCLLDTGIVLTPRDTRGYWAASPLAEYLDTEYIEDAWKAVYLKNVRLALADTALQAVVQDASTIDSLKAIGTIQGQLVSLENAYYIQELSTEKKGELIQAAQLLHQACPAHKPLEIGAQSLMDMASNSEEMTQLADPDYIQFLRQLETVYDMRISLQQLTPSTAYPASLSELWKDAQNREILFDPTVIQLVKRLGPTDNIHFFNVEKYQQIAYTPNIHDILDTLESLESLGIRKESLIVMSDAGLRDLLDNLANPADIALLNDPEASTTISSLASNLGFNPSVFELTGLLHVLRQQEQSALLQPENQVFLKGLKHPSLHLEQAEQMVALPEEQRALLTRLAQEYQLHPTFNEWSIEETTELLAQIAGDPALQERLFSTETRVKIEQIAEHSKMLTLNDYIKISESPPNFLDFLAALYESTNYTYQGFGLTQLINLSRHQENVLPLLRALQPIGYSFSHYDEFYVLAAADHAPELSLLLPILIQQGFSFNGTDDHRLELSSLDLAALTILSQEALTLATSLQALKEAYGYTLALKDCHKIAYIARHNLTTLQLQQLEQLYQSLESVSDPPPPFSIDEVKSMHRLSTNPAIKARLEHTLNRSLFLEEAATVSAIAESKVQQEWFNVVDQIAPIVPTVLTLQALEAYSHLEEVHNLTEKIVRIKASPRFAELKNPQRINLLATLDADMAIYEQFASYCESSFVKNSRDVTHRLERLSFAMDMGRFSPGSLNRIIELSESPQTLDTLTQLVMSNRDLLGISSIMGRFKPLDQAQDEKEAAIVLSKSMTSLALPRIYQSLENQSLHARENALLEKAEKDPHFAQTLEICCRSAGIYAQKYPSGEEPYPDLMRAIRQSLELNYTAQGEDYASLRARESNGQLLNAVDPFPETQQQEILHSWLNTRPKRQARMDETSIIPAEATKMRLDQIQQLAQGDLTPHVKTLLLQQLEDLNHARSAGTLDSASAARLDILQNSLLDERGDVRQDIPRIYRHVRQTVTASQKTLKDPKTQPSERAMLGKNLGLYQGLSEALLALYRLNTLNDQRLTNRPQYTAEIQQNVAALTASLKRLRLLDLERPSKNQQTNDLEQEVARDLGNIQEVLSAEGVGGQRLFETSTTVDFNALATAPDLTQSCQRLTESTGYNHAAYSRLLDGIDQLVQVNELRQGQLTVVARCFTELFYGTIGKESEPTPLILLDRLYVDPQYGTYQQNFSQEIVSLMLDRVASAPSARLLFNPSLFSDAAKLQVEMNKRGYQVRKTSGSYKIQQSCVADKYYDAFYGIADVTQEKNQVFEDKYIIERLP